MKYDGPERRINRQLRELVEGQERLIRQIRGTLAGVTVCDHGVPYAWDCTSCSRYHHERDDLRRQQARRDEDRQLEQERRR